MERLFAEDDYRFPGAQEGYHPSVASNLRRKRVAVFRSYLKCLKADFGRLDAAVQLYMASLSPRPARSGEGPAEAEAGVHVCRDLRREWRFWLFRFGLGTVDVHGLVGSLDGMRVCNLARWRWCAKVPLDALEPL